MISDKKKAAGVGLAAGALAAIAVSGAVGLIAVYTGAYNVAATEEHSPFVRWAFHTTFHNSVERRAPDVGAPQAITPTMIASGASAYKSMCEHCHGGPGAGPADWAGGMRPKPPHLAEAAGHWELNEVFWIAKHGVKMTGMPAFGPTHDDAALWGIAAFVRALPAMTPETYAGLGDASGHGHAEGGGHGHGGGHRMQSGGHTAGNGHAPGSGHATSGSDQLR